MYELNLDKDQGPYLSKDIMHSNPRSIALLAGSQIVKSFSTLNQTLKLTETKQRQYDSTLSSIENFTAMIKSLDDEIERNVKVDRRLKVEEGKLRNQFCTLNDTIIDSNNQLLEQYMPLLKGLHRVVKEQASLQKQENFRLERELKSMIEAKKQLLEGIFKCEEKIIAIEGCFGTKTPEPRESY